MVSDLNPYQRQFLPTSAGITPARFEKYLRDYAAGRPSLESAVRYKLGRDEDSVSSRLANRDVAALRLYSGYTAGLSYTRKARVVAGLESATAVDFKALYA
jgi:hypothetical protein